MTRSTQSSKAARDVPRVLVRPPTAGPAPREEPAGIVTRSISEIERVSKGEGRYPINPP